MATYTTNYNLKKPAASDTVDISDINGNMDTIDTTLKGLSDDKLAKVTSTDGYNRLYGVDTAGAQQVVPYSSGAYANTLVYRTTDGKTSVGTPTADAHAATKKYVDDGLATKLGKTATADKAKGLIYLEPTVTTTGVLWSATSTDITSYYDGLMVVVKCPENTATGLTLKINSLTAPTIVYNVTSGISTRYSADSIIILVYKTVNNTAYWSIMDYDANTNTQMRQYQVTNNTEYSILARYNTTDKSGTYEAAYGRFCTAVTLNPSTGKITANGFIGTATKATGDEDGTNIKTYYAKKTEIPDELADLSDDSTHRVVTDTEKSTWNGKQSQHGTATASLTVNGWSSDAQTVNVSGVTASNTVIVSPAPASLEEYGECGIYCSAQGSGTLTFVCDSVPENALTVNVVILG